MSATEVNGVAVVNDEPTPSPLPIKRRDGSPVVWVQIRTLTLADGTVVFGCQHCDYTRPNPNAIRPHLRVHKEPNLNGQRGGAAADLSLNDLIRKAAALDAITADRDEWKRRAKAAEKSLRTLRNALGVEVNGRG